MPGGVYNWAQGAVLDAADLNEFVANQVIARFADTAARTAAYGIVNAPALQAGLFAWTADNGKLYYYNGTSWEEVGAQVEDGEIVTAKIADSAVTSAKIADGAIVNADVNASAAIAYSKLNLGTSIVNSDISTSAAIVDTKLATISTAGKVSNSATTATDANTASAIVARDASGNFIAGKATLATADINTVIETANIVASASTGTINIDFSTNPTVYYTGDATNNWTLNVRGTSSVTLNNTLATGQIATVTFLATIGTTQKRPTVFQVDGSAVTPKWMGGTAPTTGNASSIDAYTLSIIKTGSATFTVLASQTKFA
jgi:hypothetical protein